MCRLKFLPTFFDLPGLQTYNVVNNTQWLGDNRHTSGNGTLKACNSSFEPVPACRMQISTTVCTLHIEIIVGGLEPRGSKAVWNWMKSWSSESNNSGATLAEPFFRHVGFDKPALSIALFSPPVCRSARQMAYSAALPKQQSSLSPPNLKMWIGTPFASFSTWPWVVDSMTYETEMINRLHSLLADHLRNFEVVVSLRWSGSLEISWDCAHRGCETT